MAGHGHRKGGGKLQALIGRLLGRRPKPAKPAPYRPRGNVTLEQMLTPDDEKTVPFFRHRMQTPVAQDSSVMPEPTERVCPRCGAAMEGSVAQQDAQAGRAYLRCTKHPGCGGRLEI